MPLGYYRNQNNLWTVCNARRSLSFLDEMNGSVGLIEIIHLIISRTQDGPADSRLFNFCTSNRPFVHTYVSTLISFILHDQYTLDPHY